MAVATAPHPAGAGRDALVAYEALAPFYDDFTAGYAHDDWLAEVERLLLDAGLRGMRVLDVACGTGKSALPMLRRGYDVTACDLSPGMVAVARRRLGVPPERVFVADMRALPELEPFDAVTCMDDSVNYLLHERDLRLALASMARALRPGGLLLFDVNSMATYRTAFAGEFVREEGGRRFRWRGTTPEPASSGGLFTAVVEVEEAGGSVAPVASLHRQRHYPRHVVCAALEAAGMSLVDVVGQSTGVRLSTPADEERHSKLVYLARRTPTRREVPWSSTRRHTRAEAAGREGLAALPHRSM
jgi:SAM-dependent methyltransferase